MSTSTALLEILKQLKAEQQTPEVTVAPNSWEEYRHWQEMWNPNWSVAGEQQIYSSNPV